MSRLNQSDALKTFSTNFQIYCNGSNIKAVDGSDFPRFSGYQNIHQILALPNYSNFLTSFIEFLESEIKKFPQNHGLFKNLACKGYYDSTVDRILNSFNDLILINDQDRSNIINLNEFIFL